MYNIDAIHNSSMEAFLQAFAEGKRTRWMASLAWYFGRQYISNSNAFWFATAAKLTSELPVADREAILAQLSKAEDVMVDEAGDYPEIPNALARYIAEWDPAAPEVDIEVLRATAVAKVNREAAAQRGQYLTAGIGMDLVYGKKLKEAEAKLANPSISNDKIKHVVNEAEINGVSITDMAQLIVDTEAAWAELSAPIEQKRMAAKKAIAEAADAEAVQAAANVNWSDAS